jgi:hypothetical protein
VFRLTLPIEGRTWIVIGGRGANSLLLKEGRRREALHARLLAAAGRLDRRAAAHVPLEDAE